MIIFVLWERRRGEQAVLPLSFFNRRNICGAFLEAVSNSEDLSAILMLMSESYNCRALRRSVLWSRLYVYLSPFMFD